MSGWDLKRSRKFFVSFPDTPFAFFDIPRTISITQSKREGQTMCHSFFMIENVALEQNFWIWCSFRAYMLLKKLQKVLFWEGAQGLQMASKNFLGLPYTYRLFSQTSLGP